MSLRRILILLLVLAGLLAACGSPVETGPATEPDTASDPVADPEPGSVADSEATDEPLGEDLQGTELIIYSGRSQSLVGPLLKQFQAETGIEVGVRWGKTAELAATLLEEGERSPANVFYAQDPGGLGAAVDLLAALPENLLDRVDPRFRDPQKRWVGVSGRARVVVYNTERLSPENLPQDLWGFTDPVWEGRLGWAPTNASFQAMVTAMRIAWGEGRAREWLEAMLENGIRPYENNTAIVAAVGSGEIEAGFVNHYYLYRFLAEEGEGFPARNYFLPSGGPGSLVMVSGVGLLKTGQHSDAALRLIDYLLSEPAQRYFAEQTFEYPLVKEVPAYGDLTPLAEVNALQIDLADLADLQGTILLLQEVGALP